MRYSVLAGGKRFRPILTYCVASLFDTDLNKVDSSACSVEFIHAYSLIHDDLPAMDDDDIRHNQPACHKYFDEAQAILAGDGLQALAFEVLVNDPLLDSEIKIGLLSALTHAAFEMAEGQAIDLSIVSQSVDVSVLENMHRKKTGALLSCAVDLGAITAKCSVEDRNILREFSQDIGLAYQIQDDVLDVEAPVGVLGKNQHSDSDKNKPTYPSIIGLSESKQSYQALYKKASSVLELLSVDAQSLQALIQKLQTRSF
ncbi:Octaprenyl diphosphate synthase / Dimethylallyltransferase / (2E,6E)-farnesyl diphosphate synthase / Geranylgeranyl diphosphate synthase [uncultured Candidatus Thioglobus sp.]|nr:Octaprenyl diphosphate synthase / Dimethylallyltransferase / (2E,6E)-farnesyl diphosphate synthase / Geranylgeranyl diphosphate synthase [uncultured Candidatus Thioglobus sp.]